MAGQVVYCPHMVLRNLQIDIDLDVIKEIIHCGVCNEVRQDLWLCLFRECFVKVCCATGDHRIAHQKKNKKHCLFVAVRTMRVWCTTCNGYVLLTGHNRQSVENTKPQQSTSPANNKRRNFDSIDNAENSDDETASTSMDDNQYKPTGLTGLQNIGNTCYMNAALQALSNTPPLTEFFLSCGLTSTSSGSGDTTGAKKMLTLSKSYHRLMQEIWDSKGRGYVAPTGILYGIRNAHPMFRGYHQHDTQEFLRCFMDLLHEELKVAISEPPPMSRTFENVVIPEQDDEDMSEDENADASVPNSQLNPGSLTPAPQYGEPLIAANDARPVANEGEAGGASSQSEGDEYETCDSGVSERSSLSEETTSVDTENNRSLSSSPSPLQGRLGARNGSSVGTPRSSSSYYRKKVQVQYRSIISDVFDGKLLSSVQCLTCNRISTRIEAFQDLSLPIPSRDHLHMLHQGSVNSTLAKCTELYSVEHGWLTWIREWLCSLFWGPAVSLHDCLAAFFSADELKGDNMYSCEKCNKLRNGVKFSKVLQLPEVLCIHLKRFRHDLMYSSKINSHVTFPLEGLELRPYLHKHCVSQVTQYDLISVICHHGAAGSGGHYTCYALNNQSDHWYEFDDQCVTRVSSETVRTCEAYVLFYRKRGTVVNQFRHRASNLKQRVGGRGEPVGPVYAISKQWINRFNTFAEPGPIDNSDFLCHHGRMLPGKEIDLHNLTTSLPAPVWDYIYEKFGGGPICTLDKLALCEACNNNNVTSDSQESNLSRLELEIREFSRLEQDLQRWPSGSPMNAIWLKWFVRWNAYVKGKSQEPPGPIDNGQLLNGQNRAVGQVTHGKDYRQVSKDQWDFLQRIYGGGPEVLVKLQNNQSVIEPVPTPKIPPSPSSNNNSSETEIVGDNTYSSGNWSVASSVVDNSQAGDYSHPQIPVTDPVDPHQSTHGGGDWAPSLPNQERSSPISMDVDDIELTDMTEPVSETVDSGKPVSTSLLDIRIDSTQPSNVQTTSTDSDSNTTPVHPIHSSMPTVAQEGKASDKPTDSPSASGVC